MNELLLRQFGKGLGELRTFEKGTFELLTVGGVTVGKAIYEPGWVWAEHARGADEPPTCPHEHVVLVLEGQCAVKMDDTVETTIMGPGDLVFVPGGHESWVVGDERYVSLHFLGAEGYAKD